MIFILGASGFIGNHLFNRLKEEKFNVAGSYFRNNKDGLIYFDIERMPFFELELNKKGVKHVVICAAANANIDGTRKNWDYSYDINVIKTTSIIDYCFHNDIIPIYISTDNVFDGNKGDYKETDERNPLNCYGKIRCEVENHLLDSGKEFIMLRMGKVFGTQLGDKTFLTSIIEDLNKGRQFLCADDQILTPLYIGDLIEAIKRVINKRYKGILHLSSINAMSRYRIAKVVREYFHYEKGNIMPCKINSLNLLETRPLRINLDCSKYNEISGFKQKDLTYYLSLVS
jgi:dTDP-4-dehydrorhamnose reductase